MKKLSLLLILAGILTACAAQESPSFAIVTLGANSVYVGNHGIMIPNNIDADSIADINIIYMGALYDVMNLGFWNCKTEIEKLMWLWLPWIDDICTFLVFEFYQVPMNFLDIVSRIVQFGMPVRMSATKLILLRYIA